MTNKILDKLYLEFGSGQFRACVLSVNALQAPELHLFEVESLGLRRGDVHDLPQAAAALERLLSKLENSGFSDLRSCELLLPASVTSGRVVSGTLQLHGLSIAKDHVEELREDIYTRLSDSSSEVVDLTLQSWSCGQQQSQTPPFGLRGDTLSASGFCTTIDRQVLARFVELCNAVGLEVRATHSSLVAATTLIERLSPEASNRVVVDIGHSSTTGLVMVGHRPNAAFVVRAGAHHITKDIAAALNCSISEAEHLKRSQGLQISAYSSSTPSGVPLLEASNLESHAAAASINKGPANIFPWAAPRVAEIVSLAFRHFAIYAKALDGGVTLIGGGSLTPDICSFVSVKLGCVKATRFKPSKEALSDALGMAVYHGNDVSLPGFEGILEVSSQAWKTKEQLRKLTLSHKTPTFLRPLLSWFTDLSK